MTLARRETARTVQPSGAILTRNFALTRTRGNKLLNTIYSHLNRRHKCHCFLQPSIDTRQLKSQRRRVNESSSPRH